MYAARILVSWELPTGWVSWLIVALMTVCIAIQLVCIPHALKNNKRFDNWIARWMPVLILPLLLLMTIGIVRRFNDYGITVNRLYLATPQRLVLFCPYRVVRHQGTAYQLDTHFVCHHLLLTSALPVNYAGITKNVILNEIKAEMQRSCRAKSPPLQQYEEWMYRCRKSRRYG